MSQMKRDPAEEARRLHEELHAPRDLCEQAVAKATGYLHSTELELCELVALDPMTFDPDEVAPATYGLVEVRRRIREAAPGTGNTPAVRQARSLWKKMRGGLIMGGLTEMTRIGMPQWEAAKRTKDPTWMSGRELQERNRNRSCHLKPMPKLTGDGSFGWKGQATLTAFRDLQSRGGGYTSRDSNKASTGRVQLFVRVSDTLAEPSAAAVNAFAFLEKLGDVVREELLAAAHDWCIENVDDADIDPDEIENHVGVGIVHVFAEHKDGLAYVGLECGCDWDEEHGFGVLMLGEEVVLVGDADASTNRRAAERHAAGKDLHG